MDDSFFQLESSLCFFVCCYYKTLKNCDSEFHISAIIITGGSSMLGVTTESVELLFLNGTSLCSLPSLPDTRLDHTQSGLVACGGNGGRSDCIRFSGGQWNKSHSLLYERYGHSSWSSTQHGTILIGGSGGYSTTEMLTVTGESQESFTLKYRTQ